MTDIVTRIGGYWNAAAATYDQVPGHNPQTALEWAAWRGVLVRLRTNAAAADLAVTTVTGRAD